MNRSRDALSKPESSPPAIGWPPQKSRSYFFAAAIIENLVLKESVIGIATFLSPRTLIKLKASIIGKQIYIRSNGKFKKTSISSVNPSIIPLDAAFANVPLSMS